MDRNIKGTETEKNLLKAFAGESQARNRYTYSAGVAVKEGYEQIAAIFEETADQERIHAKNFFRHLEGGDLEITASYPAGKIGTTEENLAHAAAGEHHEWSNLYPAFADVAGKEGFKDVAMLFRVVSNAENAHEARYNALLKNLKEGKVFRKDVKVKWQCRKCGYVHEGNEAPGKCAACQHPQAYFEIKKENW
ncbi:MAG: rubrerythrin family protein [Victivallales bacterium]